MPLARGYSLSEVMWTYKSRMALLRLRRHRGWRQFFIPGQLQALLAVPLQRLQFGPDEIRRIRGREARAMPSGNADADTSVTDASQILVTHLTPVLTTTLSPVHNPRRRTGCGNQ